MAGILSNLIAWKRTREAESALARGDFETAAARFDAALKIRPRPASLVKRGLALWEGGTRREGLSCMREGAKALPDAHPVRLFFALALLEEGQADQAGRILDAVKAGNPDNLFCRGLVALAFLRSGKAREAAEALEDGVFASPLFRAHLLSATESHLRNSMKKEAWSQAYLDTLL
jgi:tetratricopeptide (TPR) repeat protein